MVSLLLSPVAHMLFFIPKFSPTTSFFESVLPQEGGPICKKSRVPYSDRSHNELLLKPNCLSVFRALQDILCIN